MPKRKCNNQKSKESRLNKKGKLTKSETKTNLNIDEIHKLALQYHEQKDYDKMMKYYLMAIEKGDINSMHGLGFYYDSIKDYENMKKYYLMAIKKGDRDSMHNLALYYDNQQDYPNMEKYYLMAIEK